jgi:chemotaxis protein methyltransferase CheR
MPIAPAAFEYVQTLVRQHAAIVLEEEKAYLVETRLAPLAQREGFASIEHLVAEMRVTARNGLHRKVVEAMATSETYFFRDLRPFDALRQVVLPQLLDLPRATERLNIWSAACASGQEPYSIAMLVHESFPALTQGRLRVIASDMSADVLNRARQARYNQMEVNRGLPARLLVKYFDKQGADWILKERIRRQVEFRELNLIGPWSGLPPLDVVFLRNVLIYFDAATKKAILGKVRQALRPGGFLFLGGAETSLNLDASFQRVDFERGCCYRLLPPARP